MVAYQLVKDHTLVTADYDDTVLDVAKKMVDANIGAVPVMRNGELTGMFSERDLMRRVVVERRDATTTRVHEVISRNVVTVPPDAPLDVCSYLMKQHNVRHLPICDGGRLIGLISLRDILAFHLAEKEGEVQFMRAYIQSGS
ncbi:MAG: CBS domain-containing protein [Terriglobales bacterium]